MVDDFSSFLFHSNRHIPRGSLPRRKPLQARGEPPSVEKPRRKALRDGRDPPTRNLSDSPENYEYDRYTCRWVAAYRHTATPPTAHFFPNCFGTFGEGQKAIGAIAAVAVAVAVASAHGM